MTTSDPHLDTNTATSQPPEISQAPQPTGNKIRLIWQECFYALRLVPTSSFIIF